MGLFEKILYVPLYENISTIINVMDVCSDVLDRKHVSMQRDRQTNKLPFRALVLIFDIYCETYIKWLIFFTQLFP
jgi:hypothetical protein